MTISTRRIRCQNSCRSKNASSTRQNYSSTSRRGRNPPGPRTLHTGRVLERRKPPCRLTPSPAPTDSGSSCSPAPPPITMLVWCRKGRGQQMPALVGVTGPARNLANPPGNSPARAGTRTARRPPARLTRKQLRSRGDERQQGDADWPDPGTTPLRGDEASQLRDRVYLVGTAPLARGRAYARGPPSTGQGNSPACAGTRLIDLRV